MGLVDRGAGRAEGPGRTPTEGPCGRLDDDVTGEATTRGSDADASATTEALGAGTTTGTGVAEGGSPAAATFSGGPARRVKTSTAASARIDSARTRTASAVRPSLRGTATGVTTAGPLVSPPAGGFIPTIDVTAVTIAGP